MGEEPKGRGWWRTLPGVLAGLGTALGAITGLILALNQVGILDGTRGQAPLDRREAERSPQVVVSPPQVVVSPESTVAASDDAPVWQAAEDGGWNFFYKGKSLRVPDDILLASVQRSNLLVYVKESNEYYLMEGYTTKEKRDFRLRPARLIPSPNRTLWQAEEDGGWNFFFEGKSLKVPADIVIASSQGPDLLVYVKTSRRHYLLEGYETKEKRDFRRATRLQRGGVVAGGCKRGSVLSVC